MTRNRKDQDQEAGDPHDAHELASMWLNLMSIVIGKSVVFPAAAIEAASEFFRDNPDWNILDVLWICFQSYLVAKDNPSGDQKFFNCRRFATNPQTMFALNSDNRFRLIRMSEAAVSQLFAKNPASANELRRLSAFVF